MGKAMREQRILLKAGFALLRYDVVNKKIWKCSSPGSWKVLNRYETQTAMMQAWKAMMEDERNLAG
ncbi:MAG: hypothetical protein M0R70_12780 [Nitrospirae bacterium]|nr:hypothetical protein [Nitrospirota bacterium]